MCDSRSKAWDVVVALPGGFNGSRIRHNESSQRRLTGDPSCKCSHGMSNRSICPRDFRYCPKYRRSLEIDSFAEENVSSSSLGMLIRWNNDMMRSMQIGQPCTLRHWVKTFDTDWNLNMKLKFSSAWASWLTTSSTRWMYDHYESLEGCFLLVKLPCRLSRIAPKFGVFADMYDVNQHAKRKVFRVFSMYECLCF